MLLRVTNTGCQSSMIKLSGFLQLVVMELAHKQNDRGHRRWFRDKDERVKWGEKASNVVVRVGLSMMFMLTLRYTVNQHPLESVLETEIEHSWPSKCILHLLYTYCSVHRNANVGLGVGWLCQGRLVTQTLICILDMLPFLWHVQQLQSFH